MSIKHSLASKARWARVSKKERSERMSAIAKKRQAMLSPLQKKRMIARMVRAKKQKVIKNKSK